MSYRHQISPDRNPQRVVLSVASAQSTAVAAGTNAVRLCSDVDCWILIGANPTATVTSNYLPAKVPQVMSCSPGDKVAGIAGGAGNLYISEALSVQ